MSPSEQLLLVSIGLLTLYVLGVGGATAAAIRIRERWRQRKIGSAELAVRPGREVVLSAPSLTRTLRLVRFAGWAAFPPALVLGIFADTEYPWVVPVVVIVMVALNAFYFTAMQNMGDELTLAPDGFRLGHGGRGAKSVKVRWAHVTEFTGARVGAFTAAKMSEAGEWQDPRTRPNVIFYRLNRALVALRKSVIQRLLGFTYYDGVIRNAFGIPTEVLLSTLREWQRVALESEALPIRPARARP